MNNQASPVHYREILLKEYTKRKLKNPRYSLRAYAKFLGLTASRLSEIFSHKRGMSPEMAHKIVDKLEFSAQERELFLDLVEAEEARSALDRNLAAQRIQDRIKKYSEIDIESFQMIADWYHLAILDYLKLENCTHNTEAIAKHLSLTHQEVSSALQRLIKLQFLEYKDGKYLIAERRISTPATDVPSEAVRLHHSGILEKAKTALHAQPVENRFFQSVTIPISKEDIPMIKKSFFEFQESLSAQLTASPRKNAVYAIHFNFFELTEKMNE